MSENMDRYFEALQGMTHLEWTKLSIAINRSFDLQKSELVLHLQLADQKRLKEITQSIFG